MGGVVYGTAQLWRAEVILQESVLFFDHLDPGIQDQACAASASTSCSSSSSLLRS